MTPRPADPHHDRNGRFAAAVDVVLDPLAPPGESLAAARAMAEVLAELSGVDDGSVDPAVDAATVLAGGRAISPRDAARCALDAARTGAFLRGAVAALGALLERHPGQVIEVVYAGCGPYATLAAPLCTRFPACRVRFTLIDVHPRSLAGARAVFEGLGYADRVRECVCCDAVGYRQPRERPLHLVVVEAMQRGLTTEPQLAIAAALAPQLVPGGLLLPQRVTVELALADLAAEHRSVVPGREPPAAIPRDRIRVGTLLEVTRESAAELVAMADADGWLPPVACRVPEVPTGSSYSVVLLTRIEVFGGEVLDDSDSGLTCPVVLHDLGRIRGGEELELRYRLGPSPGFRHRVVSPAAGCHSMRS